MVYLLSVKLYTEYMTTTDMQLPITPEVLRATLRKHGVISASVFGSYARGEQTPQSDLDLFIKCGPGTSLFDVFDLNNELEQLAGTKVDLVTKISRNFREYIEPELIDLGI